MRIEIPNTKLDFWVKCAKDGIARIKQMRLVNKGNLYDDDYYVCQQFLLSVSKNPDVVYLTGEEVESISRWETIVVNENLN